MVNPLKIFSLTLTLRSYQLYDLYLDPWEANNLFDGKSYSEKRPIVLGELKKYFDYYKGDLHLAVEAFFGPYILEEFEKGYKGPEYPSKMWSKYFKVRN